MYQLEIAESKRSPMPQRFGEWLHGAQIGIGWCRYSQMNQGNNFVCAISYMEVDVIETCMNLDGGDHEAIEAGLKLREWENTGKCWIGHGTTPAMACLKAEQSALIWYVEQGWHK